MKLLLFGGTFDPPHIGHVKILQNAILTVKPDEVWVMPAGIPPHKQASATPARLRLQMCSCFKPLFKPMFISDWEIQREGKSYTLNTVEWLHTQKPNAKIALCIGSDMLLSFTSWHCWQQLLQQVTLVVQNRRGQDVEAVEQAACRLKAQDANIIFTGGEVEEISSSALRRQLAAGQDVWGYIPKEAADIIRENGLYLPQG